ncbi:MAG: hypothetical protein IT306_26450 [Chloroflexi bacterium]|nr:hypothetical protein [Chloroflexota bacterium]
MAQDTSVRGRIFESVLQSHLGEAYLANGRIHDAVRLCQQALDHAPVHGERSNKAYALKLAGDIATRRSPPESRSAEESYRRAFTLAVDLGMRPLQARCHVRLGNMYRRLARQNEARAELSTGISMLQAMGMTYWLREAEVTLDRADQSHLP